MKQAERKSMLLWGLIAGAIAASLAAAGNPGNMAICAACFVRDIAGALGLHRLAVAQYLRPEILGLILGACVFSTMRGEYQPKGGSSTLVRFILGMVMMIGALVFLGCPTRLVLRMASGDLSAYVGLCGLVPGIACGAFFIRRGFSLGRPQRGEPASRLAGYAFPALVLCLLLSSFLVSGFQASTKGPGSQHAPVLLSLVAGLGFGAIAQHTRMCYSGAFRNLILMRNPNLLLLVLGTFVAMLVYNLWSGDFQWAAYGPIAHNQTLWNLLGMFVVGFAAVLLGGCPLRQLILSGQGSWDAAVTVLGMLFGAALAHNFKLAAAPSKLVSSGGPGAEGKVAIAVCIAVLFGVAFVNRVKRQPKAEITA